MNKLVRHSVSRLRGQRSFLVRGFSQNALLNSLYRSELDRDSCGVGMLASLKSLPSRDVVVQANQMLARMAHRGGCGCEANTGDGAGMLLAMPHTFFKQVLGELGGRWVPSQSAAGMVFFPVDEEKRAYSREIFESVAKALNWEVMAWREVPTDNSSLGKTAKLSEPVMEQVFLRPSGEMVDAELSLFKVRSLASKLLSMNEVDDFYICTLNTKTIAYKGQLTPAQLEEYFVDMKREDFQSHFALVHSRFSTNTFPSWDRAQPNRLLCHNGEINTLRGNTNWMTARYQKMIPSLQISAEEELRLRQLDGFSELSSLTQQTGGLLPVCSDKYTDSGNVDAVLELLSLGSSRSLADSMLLLIPEAWQNTGDSYKRPFYEYNSCLMEPWDGPAMMAFSNGDSLGAVLDRNGLRPSRYYVTKDDHVMLSSEIGVLPELDHSSIRYKGRLEPGKMFLIDFTEGRIVLDEEVKRQAASRMNYQAMLDAELVVLPHLKVASPEIFSETELTKRLNSFGHTIESLEMITTPMAETGKEPLGSMGCDAPLAVLSLFPRPLSEYFKQLFAQVTNPPIDPIREEIVMSLRCPVGPEKNILDTSESHCRRLVIEQPVLSEGTLELLKRNRVAPHFKSAEVQMTFKPGEGENLESAIDRLNEKVASAARSGANVIVMSHRGVDEESVGIPSLLATGAVHHHLLTENLRTDVVLVVESGDSKEVHDFCTLVGFGADAVCPFLSFAAIRSLHKQGRLSVSPETSPGELEEKYIKAVGKGMLKVMAKMGISTLQSYKGAQIFEAVGLGPEVMEKCFKGTTSRLKGASFASLEADVRGLHELGFSAGQAEIRNVGDFHYRHKGEAHQNDPASMVELQVAVRQFDQAAWDRYSAYSREQNRKVSLRGSLLIHGIDEVKDVPPQRVRAIPIEQVEPATEIMKRFATGAMSLGSISSEAHEALATAMNRIKARSNTGEGGEDPIRYEPLANGDSLRSSIKQVASGRFGVTAEYLVNSDQVQIKMAQGAKPGEGGELPGYKVSEEIARVRGTTPGVGLISPPPHHDIYSIEDLAQLVYDLKNSNSVYSTGPINSNSSLPPGEVSVKLVSEVGVGIVAAGVAKTKADHIVISGGDGGTGAAAWTGVHRAGLPWELGLAEAQQTLVLNNLRSRVRLQVDGQLKTARDVIIGAMLGAEEFGFATAPLIALGCIMMRKCHLNTCPVGIATQDKELRDKFTGVPDHVVNFFHFLAEDIRMHMAALGITRFQDLVGNTRFLAVDRALLDPEVDDSLPASRRIYPKAQDLDLTPLLVSSRDINPDATPHWAMPQDHELEAVLDHVLLAKAEPLINNVKGSPDRVYTKLTVSNHNRSLGAMLSARIAKVHGAKGLPDDSIVVTLKGSAGQSLGFILMKGVTFELEGDANDSVGKGMCGGKLIVHPPRENLEDPLFKSEENIIIGNVALYGATSGEAYFSGVAGERFCVRNSGVSCVVEGVGDHGCEYMTGGRVVILGKTGRNFAAGMSGGIAFVLDEDGSFASKCNQEMVSLERVSAEDNEDLLQLIEKHRRYTGSSVAGRVLLDWDSAVLNFVKVMPDDYKKVLEAQKQQEQTVEASLERPLRSYA